MQGDSNNNNNNNMDLVLIPVVIAVCRRETRLNNLKTNRSEKGREPASREREQRVIFMCVEYGGLGGNFNRCH